MNILQKILITIAGLAIGFLIGTFFIKGFEKVEEKIAECVANGGVIKNHIGYRGAIVRYCEK